MVDASPNFQMNYARTASIASLILSLITFTTHTAGAAEVRTGERVYVSAETSINEDLYAAAKEVIIDGVVQGDVVAVGSKVTIHGRVEGSVMAAGGTVIVDGKVGRSVRLSGGEVRVNGEVGGDAMAACGTCAFGATGKVGTDLFVAGGELDLAGTVARGLRAAGGKVRLAGTAQRDAQVRAGTLRVEASAAMPSLVYGAQEPASISAGARISRVEIRPDWAPAKSSRIGGSLLGALMALLTGAGLLFLLRARATSASQVLERRPGASLLFGLLVAIAAPLLIGLSLITVVAIPLSLFFTAAYLFALYFGYLSSAHLLGDLMLRKVCRSAFPMAAFALGILTLWLVSLIPGLGALVGMLATLAGFGSLWLLFTNCSWFSTRFRRSSSICTAATATSQSPAAERPLMQQPGVLTGE